MSRAQALALYNLLQLAEQGLLDRVRQCARQECRKWFFARFATQKFDDKECQLAAYHSDPQWKQYRREYMKKLRRDEKVLGR
jgi:hypothetical protein